MNYQKDIDSQEEEDRWITTALLQDILTRNGYSNITCTPTPIKCSVDLNCSCTDPTQKIDFNVEIKKSTKTQQQLELYPHALLKKDKLQRMFNASPNKPVYFVLLQNEEYSYIFNCSTIDWSKVELVNLRQKVCQVDPNSRWATYPTFRIPYELGKKVNIKNYYNQYQLFK